MNLQENVDGYIQLVKAGKAMEAFDKYYDDSVVMQENSEEPRVGKEANRKYEVDFFSAIEVVHGSSIDAVAVNEKTGHVFIQAGMDATIREMGRVTMEEVQVQTWKDGKIIHERFFYNMGS